MHTRLRLWPSHTSTRTRARMPRPSRPPPQNAGALSRTEPTSLTSVAGVDSSSAVGTALPPSRTPNQSEAPTRGTHEEDSNAIVMHQGHRRGPPPDYSSARKSHSSVWHIFRFGSHGDSVCSKHNLCHARALSSAAWDTHVWAHLGSFNSHASLMGTDGCGAHQSRVAHHSRWCLVLSSIGISDASEPQIVIQWSRSTASSRRLACRVARAT